MKKALIVLLILAVAGGLFAQTFSWGGYVNTGIGMLKLDDADDPTFGLLARDSEVNGIRAQLNFAYTNADGDAGFSGRIRAQGTPADFAGYTQLRHAYGWFRAFEGLFELRGGRINATRMDSIDANYGWNFFDSYGLQAYILPTDMITIGFGGFTGANGLASGAIWDADALTLWGGLGVNAGVFRLNAQFEYKKSATDIFASAAIPLGIIDINAGAMFYNLNEYSDVGRMLISGRVTFHVMDGLGLYAFAIFGSDSAADDPFLNFGGEVDFTIGSIKPSLGVRYASGGTYNYGSGLARGQWGNYTFVKDQSYLTINPAVTLFAAPGSSVELGVVLNMDLGSANAAGSSDKGMSYAAYVGYLLSF